LRYNTCESSPIKPNKTFNPINYHKFNKLISKFFEKKNTETKFIKTVI